MNRVCLVLVILLQLALAQADPLDNIEEMGTDYGNGGDAIFCRPSHLNNFEGFYSLDYLAQFNGALAPKAVASLSESFDRIEQTLQSKLPELVQSFRDFRASLFAPESLLERRIWQSAPNGLADLIDEALVGLLPENCRDGIKASIMQAVVRRVIHASNRKRLIYSYDPFLIARLSSNNPIQLSFLLVHEWLWDFSSNVNLNRRINYWLHTDILNFSTSDELASDLEKVGFAFKQESAAQN